MVDQSVIDSVRRYLSALREAGIHVQKGVIFGSFARGEAHKDSDIDLMVIAPEFDESHDYELRSRLWQCTVRADTRIEPIACGVREWIEDDEIPIFEIARKEGITIEVPEEAA